MDMPSATSQCQTMQRGKYQGSSPRISPRRISNDLNLKGCFGSNLATIRVYIFEIEDLHSVMNAGFSDLGSKLPSFVNKI